MRVTADRPWRGVVLAIVLAALVVGVGVRVWDLSRPDLSFDEAFTLDVARQPVGDIPGVLRTTDAHPPLDYLVRHPVATGDVTTTALRLPSVVCAVAALFAFAAWMRRRGLFGAMATVLMALSAFYVMHGQEARMYAGMALLGVLAAWTATTWLERPRPAHGVAVGAIALTALFLHASGLLLGLGLLAVAGLRRDRAAWWWRVGLGAPLLVWAGLWGPSFLDQADRAGDLWVPFTSPAGLARTVNELVDLYPAAAWLGLATVVVAGVVLLMTAEPALRRVWLCCFLLPLVLLTLGGVRNHVLLPRTLAFAAWGPLVALAAVVNEARRRWTVLGIVAGTAALLLVVPSLLAAPWRDARPHEAAFDRVEARSRGGDVVAVHPAWLAPLVRWRIEGRAVVLPRRLYATGVMLPGPATGRVWVVEPDSYAVDDTGYSSCAAPVDLGRYRVRCLAKDAMAASGYG